MCLAETYNRVRVGMCLSDMFSIRNGLKQGDDLSPLLFNSALDCAIRRVQVDHDGLKLNGTYQLLVYADDVNILGGSVHTINKNAEALVVASKEIGLEINADETKYLVMSHEIRMQDETTVWLFHPFRGGRVQSFGRAITNQSSIQEEIKSRLKLGNICCHSVQNLLSSNLLSKNLKVKIHRTTILPFVLYGCETWSLTLWEERRLRLFENRVWGEF